MAVSGNWWHLVADRLTGPARTPPRYLNWPMMGPPKVRTHGPWDLAANAPRNALIIGRWSLNGVVHIVKLCQVMEYLDSHRKVTVRPKPITSLCYLSRLYWVKDDCTLVLKQALPLSWYGYSVPTESDKLSSCDSEPHESQLCTEGDQDKQPQMVLNKSLNPFISNTSKIGASMLLESCLLPQNFKDAFFWVIDSRTTWTRNDQPAWKRFHALGQDSPALSSVNSTSLSNWKTPWRSINMTVFRTIQPQTLKPRDSNRNTCGMEKHGWSGQAFT